MQSHMQEKKMVIARMRERYRRATKKTKGEMLAHLIAAHRYNRNYAARLLRGGQAAQRVACDDGRGRPACYAPVYPDFRIIPT